MRRHLALRYSCEYANLEELDAFAADAHAEEARVDSCAWRVGIGAAASGVEPTVGERWIGRGRARVAERAPRAAARRTPEGLERAEEVHRVAHRVLRALAHERELGFTRAQRAERPVQAGQLLAQVAGAELLEHLRTQKSRNCSGFAIKKPDENRWKRELQDEKMKITLRKMTSRYLTLKCAGAPRRNVDLLCTKSSRLKIGSSYR